MNPNLKEDAEKQAEAKAAEAKAAEAKAAEAKAEFRSKLPPDRQAFYNEVDSLIPVMKNWVETLPEGERHEWLRYIHERYSEKFINDNNKIWTIGSILIPASLAGLLTIKDLRTETVIPIAAGSIFLILFWNNFADHHRAFQSKSEAVAKAVEQYMKLDTGSLKIGTPFLTVQKIRKLLTWGVSIVWICVVLIVTLGK